MKRSLTRCQFVAFAAGVAVCALYYALSVLATWMRLRPGPEWTMLTLIVLLFVLPAYLAYLVATYAGRHENVAFLTTLIPCVGIAGLSLVLEEDMRIALAARHVMDSGLHAGGLSSLGSVAIFLGLAAAAAQAGIVWKRRGNPVPENDVADPPEKRRWIFPLFFAVFASGLVVAVLQHFASVRQANSPAGRVAEAREVLEDPASTLGEKARVLFDLQNLIKEQASVEILSKAAREQPEPLNLLAAAGLARRGNVSALPFLEPSLMKSGQWKHSWKEFSGSANLGQDLGMFTDPAAVPALVRLMKSEDEQVRRAAIRSLRNIKGDSAVDAMLAR